jgi:betaine-aldehyde dehydrogenase
MHQYIAGRLEDGTGEKDLTVLDPATGRIVGASTHASPEDVGRAVAAARAALPGWAAATPGERSTLMHKLAVILDRRSAELAALETSQTGKPIRLSSNFDVPGTVDNVAFFAGAARHLEGKAQAEYSGAHSSSIRREPIGVVGSIAPWNYPLQMAAWKILPAIAAGNTIVLKPAEITPLTALAFAEACTEAGIPAGVVNVVTGRGGVAGEALIAHPDVDMVSFTGSTPVGKRIAELASRTVKRVHLELGGKAPFVVFDDADLEAAIHGAVAGSLINTGQDCTAATRAYVHRSRFGAFVEGVAELFRAIRLGDPNDPATDLGPLSSTRQRDAVAGYVERARGYGAEIVVGGEFPAELRGTEFEAGAYYRPTLVTGVSQDAEIVRQELFGPVLVALPFDDDDEAIRLANDTPFGLAASAWTKDLVRAHKASRELKAGCVWINDHIPIISEMPHGGYKQSGYGKDMSAYSLEEYTQIKHVMHDITGTARKDWHRTIFAA